LQVSQELISYRVGKWVIVYVQVFLFHTSTIPAIL
jgi:hypothetical protein